MSVYIQSAEAISPLDTFQVDSLHAGIFNENEEQENSEKEYLSCIHPDYKEFISPTALRRMSPVIRMGLAASKVALEKAGLVNADAILVGSGLGCVRDTAKFLNQLINQQELLLNPTAFIQSTHNTVSGQIALMLGCREYNLTFSQNSISFQTALLEGMMLLGEGEARNIILGGIDEVVDESFQLMDKSGCVAGVVGEGSNFFVISSERTEGSMARIDAVDMLNGFNTGKMLIEHTRVFLATKGLEFEDIDLFISGRNGDGKEMDVYREVEGLFSRAAIVGYKHLVGEYDTASAFGTWLAARIIRDEIIPKAILIENKNKRAGRKTIGRALVFNHYKERESSWILLSHTET